MTIMQVLGLMAVGHPVVPLELLQMRHLQRWFTSLCLDTKTHKDHIVSIPPSVQENLRYWGSP